MNSYENSNQQRQQTSPFADPSFCSLLRQCQTNEETLKQPNGVTTSSSSEAFSSRLQLLCSILSPQQKQQFHDYNADFFVLECESQLSSIIVDCARAGCSSFSNNNPIFKSDYFSETPEEEPLQNQITDLVSIWTNLRENWSKVAENRARAQETHTINLSQFRSQLQSSNSQSKPSQPPPQQSQVQGNMKKPPQRPKSILSNGKFDPAASLLSHLKMEEEATKRLEKQQHEEKEEEEEEEESNEPPKQRMKQQPQQSNFDPETGQRKLDFISAAEKLAQDEAKKGFGGRSRQQTSNNSAATTTAANSTKTLGGKRKFVSPVKKDGDEPTAKKKQQEGQKKTGGGGGEDSSTITDINGVPLDDPRLRNIDPYLLERVNNDILDKSPLISWSDIAGLEFAKKCVTEAVVWPLLRPDIFKGLRGPPKGLLLFGPPGTGKTMIGKAIASESRSTFFNISASALTSKWIGEAEKTVRALFAVAKCYPRSVIFIDEIDSILTQRSENENEASRRLKTEFLVQLDGAGVGDEEHILVVGATNRPQELDEAARRRLVKRLYIALPDSFARNVMIKNLLKSIPHDISDDQFSDLAERTAGYSGSDIKALCQDASLGPIREVEAGGSIIINIDVGNIRPVMHVDLVTALSHVRASVSQADLQQYIEWNTHFGSFPILPATKSPSPAPTTS